MAAPALAFTSCPECGVENGLDHNFCKHCGHTLKDDLKVYVDLGHGDPERTRDRCLALVKAYPNDARAHFALGLAYYHLGQAGNAARAFQRVIEIDDGFAAAHFHLALCHYRSGKMNECVASARRAIAHNPQSAPAHFRLAIALFHLGKLEEAAHWFRQTLAVDPDYVIALYHLGVIQERLSDVDGAIESFERVVRVNAGDASAHYHLGILYERKGMECLAMSELSTALELDPSDGASAEALQALQR